MKQWAPRRECPLAAIAFRRNTASAKGQGRLESSKMANDRTGHHALIEEISKESVFQAELKKEP